MSEVSEPILTIMSEQNAVELTLTEASVTMKLSESLLEEVCAEMRNDKDVQADGFAGKLARFITSSVDKLFSRTIEYPLADIASVDYVDGGLAFTYNKKHLLTFDTVSVSAGKGKESVLCTFAEADARAFVAKFREAKVAVH